MTAANPPEAELPLSRQGHQSKNEFTFLKRRPNDGCDAQLIFDSCGVRTHALADWRLKPAP